MKYWTWQTIINQTDIYIEKYSKWNISNLIQHYIKRLLGYDLELFNKDCKGHWRLERQLMNFSILMDECKHLRY